jgi:hypothetical protein
VDAGQNACAATQRVAIISAATLALIQCRESARARSGFVHVAISNFRFAGSPPPPRDRFIETLSLTHYTASQGRGNPLRPHSLIPYIVPSENPKSAPRASVDRPSSKVSLDVT